MVVGFECIVDSRHKGIVGRNLRNWGVSGESGACAGRSADLYEIERGISSTLRYPCGAGGPVGPWVRGGGCDVCMLIFHCPTPLSDPQTESATPDTLITC